MFGFANRAFVEIYDVHYLLLRAQNDLAVRGVAQRVCCEKLRRVLDVSGLGAHRGQASAERSNGSENNGRLPVRSDGHLSRESSKRVQTGGPRAFADNERVGPPIFNHPEMDSNSRQSGNSMRLLARDADELSRRADDVRSQRTARRYRCASMIYRSPRFLRLDGFRRLINCSIRLPKPASVPSPSSQFAT
jgi:hypothetical protein